MVYDIGNSIQSVERTGKQSWQTLHTYSNKLWSNRTIY